MIAWVILPLLVCVLGAGEVVVPAPAPMPAPMPPVAAAGDAIWELQLFDGLSWNGRRLNYALQLASAGGRWRRAWGWYLNAAVSLSHGYVSACEAGPERMAWDLVLNQAGDQYQRRGQFGRYQIVATKGAADGAWNLRYTAVVNGEEIAGTGLAFERPLPLRRAGYTPIAPGEHPRLLFRASELPALRQRLATPFGQAAKAAMEASGDPGALGMLYQITGDRSYAERARPAFEKLLADEDFGAYRTGQVWAHRLLSVSVAWDCLRSLWDEAYNRQVEQTLLTRIEMLCFNCGGNNAPTSNWAGPVNAAAGMTSLLFAGDQGDGPPPPGSLIGGRTRLGNGVSPLRLGIYRGDEKIVVELPPFAGVVDAPAWLPGQPLADWVWTGVLALDLPAKQDLLGAVGGSAKAVPLAGMSLPTTAFTSEGPQDISLRFTPLPPALSGAELTGAKVMLGEGKRIALLSTRFSVAADTVVRIAAQPAGTSWMLDAVDLVPGRLFLLRAGGHRLLITANVRDGEPPLRLDPNLMDAGAAGAGLAEGVRLFASLERGDWEAKGRPDFAKEWSIEATGVLHQLYVQLGMGEFGFHAETGHYSHDGGPGHYSYALMRWNVLGCLTGGRPGIERYVPRHVISNPVGPGTPRLRGLPINGINHPLAVAYPRSFPFIDPAWQPACLWLWQQDRGIDPDRPETALKTDPMITFLTYPLEMKPEPPRAGVWPLAAASTFRGWYGFRQRYQDGDDGLVQVFANASNPMGWSHPNAGTFAVQCLGRAWATSTEDRVGYRPLESVVQIIGAPIDHGGGFGRVRSHRSGPGGSGALTIDLSDVYERTSCIDKNGIIAKPLAGPLTLGRCVLVDWSGSAGCPLVLVVLDRIDGLPGLKRHWQWMLPADLRGGLACAGRAFTASAPEGTLRVTFAHPAAPVFVRPGAATIRVNGNGHDTRVRSKAPKNVKPANKEDLAILQTGSEVVAEDTSAAEAAKKEAALLDLPLDGVGVLSDDHVFAVATIGPGEAPPVTVAGAGLDAVITIGKRSYRFDGDGIVATDR